MESLPPLQAWSITVQYNTAQFCLFLAVLGLRCCAWISSSCGKQGLLVIAACRPSLQCPLCQAQALGSQASIVAAHGLGSCGTWVSCCIDVEYSQTEDGTCVPCIGRRILNHRITRKVP